MTVFLSSMHRLNNFYIVRGTTCYQKFSILSSSMITASAWIHVAGEAMIPASGFINSVADT